MTMMQRNTFEQAPKIKDIVLPKMAMMEDFLIEEMQRFGIENFILLKNGQEKDEPPLLYEFFHTMTESINDHYPSLFAQWKDPESLLCSRIKYLIDTKEDGYKCLYVGGDSKKTFESIKKLASLLSDPLLYTQWERTRKQLLEQHNYFEQLDAILKGGDLDVASCGATKPPS